jgi:hypothetical protein
MNRFQCLQAMVLCFVFYSSSGFCADYNTRTLNFANEELRIHEPIVAGRYTIFYWGERQVKSSNFIYFVKVFKDGEQFEIGDKTWPKEFIFQGDGILSCARRSFPEKYDWGKFLSYIKYYDKHADSKNFKDLNAPVRKHKNKSSKITVAHGEN